MSCMNSYRIAWMCEPYGIPECLELPDVTWIEGKVLGRLDKDAILELAPSEHNRRLDVRVVVQYSL